jgi:hypothetical protein
MKILTQRGSGLLLAMIVVLVLTVVAVGVIRFSSRELAGAYAGRQEDSLVACAEAGRQLLLSQFRGLGVAPTSLQALNVGLDNPASGSTRAVGGHVDTSGVQIQQVALLPPGSFGVETKNQRDLTNIVFPGRAALGGKPYRILVHCVDHATNPSDPTSGRQLEVEFGVRFGI